MKSFLSTCHTQVSLGSQPLSSVQWMIQPDPQGLNGKWDIQGMSL